MALSSDFPAIFDEQIKRLNERGAPQHLINALSSRRAQVLVTATGFPAREDRVPFLPIIPRALMSIQSQMPLIRFEQACGYTLLDTKKIHDELGTPSEPYFIFDIEDGRLFTVTSTLAAEARIKAAGRSCLTDCEVISLCAHTDVLFHHFVDAAASRYEDKTKNVTLLLEGQTAKLSSSYISDKSSDWGTPSCGFRMK